MARKRPFTMFSSPSSPQFSPDGKRIAFLDKRGELKQKQIFVMDVRGGEAEQQTDLVTGVSAFQWIDNDSFGLASRVWPKLGWEDMKKKQDEVAEEKKAKQTIWRGKKLPFVGFNDISMIVRITFTVTR